MVTAVTRLLALVLLSIGLVIPAHAEQVVHVYNWSDYIDETVLDEFTKRTGIRVVYDVYDSNDILETKLLAGNSGYDVVFPSGSFLARQIQAGVFQPLDWAKLPNHKNLDPDVTKRVEKYDPDQKYGVVYMWGTTGIAYNVEEIRKRLPDAPLTSWRMVFDPDVVKHFADCGLYVLDAADEVIPAALNFISLDPDAKDAETIAKAEPTLMAMRPYVRKFHSSENISALTAGDICLAVMWSGDAGIAKSRAEEAGKDFTIQYVIPEEGAQMWFDMMAIPKDAPNPDAAHAFINFLMDPEIIARNTNYVTYPNANLASKPFIDEAILNDPTVYPEPKVMARLFVVSPYDLRSQRALTRLWQKIKTGI